MNNLNSGILTLGLTLIALGGGCSTVPSTPEARTALRSQSEAAVSTAQAQEPRYAETLRNSAGYVVYPAVGKGAFLVGGAYGRGIVFQQGAFAGYSDVTEVSVGASLGGQCYTQIVVFVNHDAINRFKQEGLKFDAQAAAVAGRSGISADADYAPDVVVFTTDHAGLIADASVGGQYLGYTDLPDATMASSQNNYSSSSLHPAGYSSDSERSYGPTESTTLADARGSSDKVQPPTITGQKQVIRLPGKSESDATSTAATPDSQYQTQRQYDERTQYGGTSSSRSPGSRDYSATTTGRDSTRTGEYDRYRQSGTDTTNRDVLHTTGSPITTLGSGNSPSNATMQSRSGVANQNQQSGSGNTNPNSPGSTTGTNTYNRSQTGTDTTNRDMNTAGRADGRSPGSMNNDPTMGSRTEGSDRTNPTNTGRSDYSTTTGGNTYTNTGRQGSYNTMTGRSDYSTTTGGNIYTNTGRQGSYNTMTGRSDYSTTTGGNTYTNTAGPDTGSMMDGPRDTREGMNRVDDRLTAQDQGQSQADVDMTANIRQRIIDSDLSTSTDNLTIITNQRRVTLRGTVPNQSEKDTVLRIAHELAGRENVTDLIQVRSLGNDNSATPSVR